MYLIHISLPFHSHGWSFGKEGACESIPTQTIADGSTTPSNFKKKACLKTYAIQEHEGLVWVWRGNLLEADATKLPQTRKDAETYPCDTILDYNVDWQYIVENNLDSPHLFWLHNGSVPPVRSLNFVREKVNQVKLKFFRDDSGLGHYGQTAGGKPKIVRFDAPNIVRHGGVSSFSEGMLAVSMFGMCIQDYGSVTQRLFIFHYCHRVSYCSDCTRPDSCITKTEPAQGTNPLHSLEHTICRAFPPKASQYMELSYRFRRLLSHARSGT